MSSLAIAQTSLGLSIILSRCPLVMDVFTDRFNNLIYDTISVYYDYIQIQKRDRHLDKTLHDWDLILAFCPNLYILLLSQS